MASMTFGEFKRQNRWWHRLSPRQREAVVEAELNRPMTPAELADWKAEILEEAGFYDEEEIDEDEVNCKRHARRNARVALIWSNPNPPPKMDDGDDDIA